MKGGRLEMKYKFSMLLLFLVLLLAACSMPGSSGTTGSSTGNAAADSSENTSRFPENPNINLEFDTENLESIWLAGGCFWGVEAYMARVYGVYDVTSGYANGTTEEPTYEEVLYE